MKTQLKKIIKLTPLNITKKYLYLPICMFAVASVAQATNVASYDIGASNWNNGSYSSTVSGLTVTGTITGGQATSDSSNPNAVYAGNNPPRKPIVFTYHLPNAPESATSCKVSIDFFHITNNNYGESESVGGFNPTPNSNTIGAGHSFTNNSIVGTNNASINIVSTLSWNLPTTLSFKIPGSSGNISLIGHKNLVIDCDYPENGTIDLVIEKPIDDSLPAPQEPDNCCAPINKDVIMRQLTPVFQPNGGSNAKYRLNFAATSQFNNQMQNYLNYVHSMKNPINSLITTWRVYEKAPGGPGSPVPTSAGWGTQIEEFFTTFHISNPVNHGNTTNVYKMKPNHWYRIQTGTYFNDDQTFFPKKCAESGYWVNWQVGAKSSTSTGEFIIAHGGKIISRVPVKPQVSSNDSDQESRIFERRKCVRSGGTYFEYSNGTKRCVPASMAAKSMAEYENKPMPGIFERRKCLKAGGVYMTNSSGSFCLQSLRTKIKRNKNFNRKGERVKRTNF